MERGDGTAAGSAAAFVTGRGPRASFRLRATLLGAAAALAPLVAGGAVALGAPWWALGFGAAAAVAAVVALARNLAPLARLAQTVDPFIDPRIRQTRAGDEMSRLTLGLAALEARLEAANRRADPARLEDPLTGLPNRLAAMRRARDEISRARRKATPMAVALIELDDMIDDLRGARKADVERSLRITAEMLVQTLRAYDIVGRWADTVFVAVMPEAEIEHAAEAVRRIRDRAIDDPALGWEDRRVSLSAGLAVLQPDDATLADIADRAAAALRKAQARGGGVEAAPGPRFRPTRLTSV